MVAPPPTYVDHVINDNNKSVEVEPLLLPFALKEVHSDDLDLELDFNIDEFNLDLLNMDFSQPSWENNSTISSSDNIDDQIFLFSDDSLHCFLIFLSLLSTYGPSFTAIANSRDFLVAAVTSR
ncbi:hypothetical protein O6P43_027553 [Quillaja saponaria]|uniref:Uncharacterized protein n=1 Tax=Quillaja saponaria TaxID=32244 RepID=A0AAD7L501_QUISA|nr:hypothetical protein O6P43_027553 [Quillaja saponaria]